MQNLWLSFRIANQPGYLGASPRRKKGLCPRDRPGPGHIAIVGFPFAGEKGDAIPADLELGSYDRLIKVTSVDGLVKVFRSDPNSVWLLDPRTSPKAEARLALIAA